MAIFLQYFRSFTFVLSLSGMAFLLLAFCYVTIDVYKIWTGAPFYYPGRNLYDFYQTVSAFLVITSAASHDKTHWPR